MISKPLIPKQIGKLEKQLVILADPESTSDERARATVQFGAALRVFSHAGYDTSEYVAAQLAAMDRRHTLLSRLPDYIN